MCEIAVIDPEQAPIQAAHQIAAKFHEEQGDGLGVLAVHNEGDSFEYDAYKSIDPHWQTLYSFFKRNYSTAWRFVIHGRAMTSGKRNHDTCHPIRVDCPKCDFEWIVHNGSVRQYDQKRGGLITAQHKFNTKVDTEVIPHTIQNLPETVEDHDRGTYNIRGNLNYLAFSEDGILVRVDQKYHLSDDFTMTCSIRAFDDPEELGFERGKENEWMLIQPDGSEPEIETKLRSVWTKRSSGNSTSGSKHTGKTATAGGRFSGVPGQYGEYAETGDAGHQYPDEPTAGTDTYTVEYENVSEWDHVTVINVAPGVIRIIDPEKDENTFVFKERQPRLYFWYSDEREPENIGKLVEQANEKYDIGGEQKSLENFPNETVTEAVTEEVTTTVAEIVDVETDELAAIREDVREAADASQEVVATARAG